MPQHTVTVGHARQAARSLLSEMTDTAWLDVDVLLCEALEFDRNMLDIFDKTELSASQRARFENYLERRMEGEPVAYITKSKGFWNIEVMVDSSTLVPRPETELVVERALYRCESLHRPAIADLGTGSGCIALALASELPGANIVATDLSPEVLAVAKRNRQILGVDNVSFSCGDWTGALPVREFDVITANPPYIAEDDPCLKDKFMSFEPRTALEGGYDGLDSIRQIVSGIGQFLKPGGWLIIEHGHSQGDAVRQLFGNAQLIDCSTFRDLASLDRVTEGRKSQA